MLTWALSHYWSWWLGWGGERWHQSSTGPEEPRTETKLGGGYFRDTGSKAWRIWAGGLPGKWGAVSLKDGFILCLGDPGRPTWRFIYIVTEVWLTWPAWDLILKKTQLSWWAGARREIALSLTWGGVPGTKHRVRLTRSSLTVFTCTEPWWQGGCPCDSLTKHCGP